MSTKHKQWVRTVFDCAASQYGEKGCSFFNYFGKRLVELVPVAINTHVLDVASGKGAVLFPLAEKVGHSGKVVGIDISSQMIKETSSIAKKLGLDWINLLQMDAENLDFPDNSFDAVFCGFALFFFPSLAKALSEFKRVLKPDGFLAVSTWGNDSELTRLINQEINILQSLKISLAITPLWTEEALRNVLQSAGFKNIKIVEETKEFSHNTPEEWWESLWAHGTRAKLENLSSKQLTALNKKVLKKAASYNKGNGLTETLQVFYGIVKNS